MNNALRLLVLWCKFKSPNDKKYVTLLSFQTAKDYMHTLYIITMPDS